jgi:hypothetical protein
MPFVIKHSVKKAEQKTFALFRKKRSGQQLLGKSRRFIPDSLIRHTDCIEFSMDYNVTMAEDFTKSDFLFFSIS